MALTKILSQKPDTPFFRPPPVNIRVLQIKEEVRVTSWGLANGNAKALQSKTNQLAIVTDGNSVSKLTIFESNKKTITEGDSYILRGYALRGNKPPFIMHILPTTQFFKGPKVNITMEITEKAKALLDPPAPFICLDKVTVEGGLMSTKGEIVEFSVVRLVRAGKIEVPIRHAKLKEGSCTMELSLWREAALVELSVGQYVHISHVTCRDHGYGPQLQSTAYTKVEAQKEDNIEVVIIGVMESDETNMKEVLLENDRTLFVSTELWQPFDADLENGKIEARVEVKGKEIQKMSKK